MLWRVLVQRYKLQETPMTEYARSIGRRIFSSGNRSPKPPAGPSIRDFLEAFWPFIRPYRWYLAVAYSATGLVTLGFLSIGLIINSRLDGVLENLAVLQTIADFGLLLILIIAASTVGSAIAQYVIAWAGANYIRNIRISVFRRVMQHGDSIIDEESSGELQTRVIADTAQLGTFIGMTIPTALSVVVGLVGALGGAIYVSPRLTIMAAGIAFVMAIPILAFAPILRRFGERLQKAEAQSGRHAGETFRSRDIVYAFNQLQRETNSFADFTNEVKKYFLSQERLQLVIFSVFRLIAFSILIGAASYGISLIASNELTVGSAIAFAFFAVRIIGSGTGVAGLITSFSVALGRAEKLIEILRLPQPYSIASDAKIDKDCELELRDICYTYPTRSSRALSSIRLVFPPRSNVAIVGMSGSGKSTLFKILLRIIEPDSGDILANGVPFSKFKHEEWRARFGFVPQSEMLTSGTVAENIAYGKPSATMDQILRASKLAYAHEFIDELPQGYQTDLGEVGARLSGGQKQRISLARSILIEPSVYLLDEATSSLDATSEEAVEKALVELGKSATVISIAHRIKTVRNADLIVVLDEGKVVNQGTHDSLLADGYYERLVSGYRG